MDARIKTVTRYVTTDGKDFSYSAWAEDWQKDIDWAAGATAKLETGSTLFDALAPRNEHAPEIFKRITKDSEMVISYWQCRETPGYKVCRVNPIGSLYVYGNAGSWSGGYGGDVSQRDLERYASDERSILSLAQAATA